MLIVLSPAKTLDLTPISKKSIIAQQTVPDMLQHSQQLIDVLRPLSSQQIGQLMSISDDLAQLNANRFASWQAIMTQDNSKPAIFSFNGDVYDGLQAKTMTAAELKFAQQHLRMLSGLYGLLRPLDLMQPYRLEMGTRLANARGKDLYAFWGNLITDALNQLAQESGAKVLLNLASEEYFKSVKTKELAIPVITPVFEDWKNGQYKVISFFAKRARGMMARYVIAHKIKKVQKIQAFDEGGYVFDAAVSDAQRWVFRRNVEAVG